MKQAKRWKVTLTANEYDGHKKETHYIWADSRNSAVLIAANTSRLNISYGVASTRNVDQSC